MMCRSNILTLIPVFAAVVLLAGCENKFSPFAMDTVDETLFVNGFLDVNADTQFVRVQLIRRQIEQTASLDDSITVTLTNTSNFETITMVDSLVDIGPGRKAHVFYSTEPIQDGVEYEIVATGKEGGFRTARTAVPRRPGFIAFPVLDSQLSTRQVVRLSNLFVEPVDIRVIYSVKRHGNDPVIPVAFPYENGLVETVAGYEVVVRLELDQSLVLAELDLPPENETTVLEKISVEYELFSDEWKPVPSTSENFFASVGTFSHDWTLSDGDLQNLGYAVP